MLELPVPRGLTMQGNPQELPGFLGLHQHLRQWEILPIQGSPLSPSPALPPGVIFSAGVLDACVTPPSLAGWRCS